ncbi:MAG: DUF2153 family protein [Desulfurococcales archaeon]|nr:DUF2153 family protein [Desulfurococcales archaeon]
MASPRDIAGFVRSLERWVTLQRMILDNFKKADERVREADRLEIIIHTRIAFNHLIKTLKAFDDWLQDPFISSNIPRDLLIEVWDTTLKITEMLLELDIKHTSAVKDLIEEAVREGRISPLLQLRDIGLGRENRRGEGHSMSI